MSAVIKVGGVYRSISDKNYCFIVLHCEQTKRFFDYYVVLFVVGAKSPSRFYYLLDDFLKKFEEIQC